MCTVYIQRFIAGIETGDGSKLKDDRIWCFPQGSTVIRGALLSRNICGKILPYFIKAQP